MNQFERTLNELDKVGKEVYIAKQKTIAFLKQFRWESLSPEQMLKILAIIKEGDK